MVVLKIVLKKRAQPSVWLLPTRSESSVTTAWKCNKSQSKIPMHKVHCKRTNATWSRSFVCLAVAGQRTPSSTSERIDLSLNGLGENRLTFPVQRLQRWLFTKCPWASKGVSPNLGQHSSVPSIWKLCMDISDDRIKMGIGNFHLISSNRNIKFLQSPFNGTDSYTKGIGDIWNFQFVLNYKNCS